MQRGVLELRSVACDVLERARFRNPNREMNVRKERTKEGGLWDARPAGPRPAAGAITVLGDSRKRQKPLKNKKNKAKQTNKQTNK